MVLADTPRRGEQGFSLVESVIAVAVLGIIVSAMVGGMATTISMSGLHRQEASTNAVMVSAAEVVKHLPYQDCPATGYSAAAVPLPGAGWSITLVVQYWNPGLVPLFRPTCPDSDDGTGYSFPIQLVTILVTAPGTAVTNCAVYSKPKSIPKSTACIAVLKRRP
jgi:prepilin-type N-terminal cleavage/methylation domain-containing protein